MAFLKKIIKNKVLVLCITVIVVSLAYKGIQKAIERYNFDEDIISSVEINDIKNDSNTESEVISNEETALVTEEIEKIEKNEKNENKLDEQKNQNKIYIYVTGEVNVPGVVILDEGSRIVDAINAAGGTTANANISKVNLVYILEDGMKVNIPNNIELKDSSSFEYITINSGDEVKDDYYKDNSSVDKEVRNKDEIVNINTATQTELETLPGIGPSLALKIINYRKENGKFSSIDEIKNVSGIGEAKFENIKGFITV